MAFVITFYFSYYLTQPYYNTRITIQPKYEDINISLSRIEKRLLGDEFRDNLPNDVRTLGVTSVRIRLKDPTKNSLQCLKFTVDVYDYDVLDTLKNMLLDLFDSKTLLPNLDFKKTETRLKLKETKLEIEMILSNLAKMNTCSPDSIAKMEELLQGKKRVRNKLKRELTNSDRVYRVQEDFYRNGIPLGHSIIPSLLAMLATSLLATVLLVIAFRHR